MSPKIPHNALVCVIHMLNLNRKQHNGCSGNIVGISFIKINLYMTIMKIMAIYLIILRYIMMVIITDIRICLHII